MQRKGGGWVPGLRLSQIPRHIYQANTGGFGEIVSVCVLGVVGGGERVEEDSFTICQGMFSGHVCVLYRGSPRILISTATTITSSSCPARSHLAPPPHPHPPPRSILPSLALLPENSQPDTLSGGRQDLSCHLTASAIHRWLSKSSWRPQ